MVCGLRSNSKVCLGTSYESKRNLAFQSRTANNGRMCSKAKGAVNLECVEGYFAVQDVLEILNLAANLLSVGRIYEKGLGAVHPERMPSANARRRSCNPREVNRVYTVIDLTMWHSRMWHLNKQGLKKLQQLADGIQFKYSNDLECVACIQGKHLRDSFTCSSSRAEETLKLVHTDS